MDRERCPSLLTKLFNPVPRVALKPWESKQGVALECEDVSLFQRCSPWDESPARMGTEKIPHVWGTEGQCGCIRCWLEGEQRGPGTHKKFTRSFSVLNFSLHSRGQAQVLLCCPVWGWYSGPDAHTPKSWVALGVFCYNCAHSRAHTDRYRKTFISVTFVAVLAVLWGFHLVCLSCEVAECCCMAFHRWCGQCWSWTPHLEPGPHWECHSGLTLS